MFGDQHNHHERSGVKLLASQKMSISTGLVSGQRICAVGDVHGRSFALEVLLDQFQSTKGHYDCSCLILLGDLIDRGPDSIGTIDVVIAADEEGRFDECVPLMGNHEQMIRLVLRGRNDMNPYIWLWNDRGGTVLRSLEIPLPQDIFAHGNREEIEAVNRDLAYRLESALGEKRVAFLNRLEHHHFAGNMLFVHAGIDPNAPLSEHLGQPWDLLEDNHWAWIRGKFLAGPVPYSNLMVIHGHSPVRMARPRALSRADFVLHRYSGGKINLDAGSFISGCVAGAEFTVEGYRLFLACEER